MENKFGISLDETLLPALMQCFGIIFLGYIMGKLQVLHQNEIRGLTIFVQYLSLPSLIFSTVSTMSLGKIKWEFVAAVFVAKACVFICVTLICIMLTHPLHLGKAGLYAIAATQSNDFALGYPLLVSLYQNTHPDYPMYLYIIAPMQLLLLNGIGFFLLEMEKQSNSDSKWKICHLLKEIFKNPVMIMTVIGLLWNVIFGQKPLPVLDSVLKSFSSAFPATALLLLGYTMTLSSNNSSHVTVSVALIILAKNLILPIILQKFSTFMCYSNDETQSLSSFGFLYGTIPTAPTAYVFATHYDSCVNIIAKIVLGSTLLSAPIMFSSASVISLVQIGMENVAFYLSQTISYLSLVNMVCCIWLLLLFCIGKRWRNVHFSITFYLVLAQFLTAIGGLLLFSNPVENTLLFFIQYVLTSGSIISTRICSVLLAVLLLIIRTRSLCYVLHMKKRINILSIIICIILPYTFVSCLILYKKENALKPTYQLGYVQILSTFILTFLTLLATMLCLILQQLYSKNKHTIEQDETYYQNPTLENGESSATMCCSSKRNSGDEGACCDIEDLGKNYRQLDRVENECNEIVAHVCDPNYPCSISRRYECSLQITQYINENQEIGTGINDNEHCLKHIGLLIALCVAMTLSLSVCLWKLIMENVNGILVELEFLDAILNYSLGTYFFILFGFDTNLLNIIYTWWKACCANLFQYETVGTKQENINEQFIANHIERCRSILAQTKHINNQSYHDVCEADSLVQWLLKENLVQNVNEADDFIKSLLIDHVIEKVYENNNFSRNLHLLRFTNLYLNMAEI